jgi:hypothetical protein
MTATIQMPRRAVLAALLLPISVSAQNIVGTPRLDETAAERLSLVAEEHLPAARAAFPVTAASNLKCQFIPIEPELTYSFRFETGFIAGITMNQFRGPGHGWEILLRVTPENGQPVYLTTSESLPVVPQTKSEWESKGKFAVGQGSYTVDALLKDDAERICKSTWHIDAKPDSTERSTPPAWPPRTITEFTARPPLAAPQLRSNGPRIGRLTVLLNAASMLPGRAQLRDEEVGLWSGSLESMLARMPVQSMRVVIFTLGRRDPLYSKDGFGPADLDAAEKALHSAQPAVVDYRTLQESHGPLHNTADLLRSELAETPDVVVMLGPYSPLPGSLNKGRLEPIRLGSTRLFYLAYRRPPSIPEIADDQSFEFRLRSLPHQPPQPGSKTDHLFPLADPDVLSVLARAAKAELSYVDRPQDFASAMRRIVAHFGE